MVPLGRKTGMSDMEDAGRWGGSGVVASGEVLGRRRIQIGEEGEAMGG